MKLSAKIVLAAGAAVVATAVGACVTVFVLSRENRVNELRGDMSLILEQAEIVAQRMEEMHHSNAVDTAGLLAAARAQSGGRPIIEVYESTAFYTAIPIVAAWRSAAQLAKEHHYEFFTPSRPDLPARNKRNDNGALYADAFKAFAAGEKEYFTRDAATNQLVIARPIRISEGCMHCHGDPSLSPTKDGKDVIGFPMEGMKLGEVKGAFVLRAPLTNDVVIGTTVLRMSVVSLALLGVCAAGFYGFTRRYINRPLDQAIEQIGATTEETTAASAEISSASQSLAEGSTEQAASLEETSASLEEMSSMTKRNADSARQAKELSHQTRSAADTGAVHMGEMRQAMDAIKGSSTDIAKIIKTIDEIAFQTNILALNAAVEAARAGEAGLGFAVVADEVRNLAQRAAQSAKETAAKIEDAMQKSERGATISTSVAAALDDIVQKARQMDTLVAEIASASAEQSQGIEQLNSAVSQMDKVTQANASCAEETAAAATELNAQATAMKQTVGELRVLIDGVSTAIAAPVVNERAAAPAKPTEPPRPAPAGPRAGRTPKVALTVHPRTGAAADDFFKNS